MANTSLPAPVQSDQVLKGELVRCTGGSIWFSINQRLSDVHVRVGAGWTGGAFECATGGRFFLSGSGSAWGAFVCSLLSDQLGGTVSWGAVAHPARKTSAAMKRITANLNT